MKRNQIRMSLTRLFPVDAAVVRVVDELVKVMDRTDVNKHYRGWNTAPERGHRGHTL